MTDPTNPSPNRRLLDPAEVAVVEVHDVAADGGTRAADWPCPGCGERRPFQRARTAVIRNVVGAQLRRTVYLCDVCLEDGFKPAGS